MSEKILEAAREYVLGLFRDRSDGHGADHTLRVARSARILAAGEPGCDADLAVLAALLHDADDRKLFCTADNANARAFLVSRGVEAERIELICRIVNSVSFSQNRGRRPNTPEGRVVQDADHLDAIGAVGIARTFAYGGSHGRPLEDSVRHFHDKLLLLSGEMNTAAGREIARDRHAFLEEFLRRYGEETGPLEEER